MGLYYADLSGGNQTVAQTSARMDQFGWTGGWRITDNAQQTIWFAQDGQGNWLFSGTPNVFVLNTVTMEITESEWDYASVDVLSAVQAIDAAY